MKTKKKRGREARARAQFDNRTHLYIDHSKFETRV